MTREGRMRHAMIHRFGTAVVLASLTTAVCVSGLAAGPQLPRTPDGHPDFHGIWNNSTQTPLQRPVALGTKQFYSDAELAKLRLHDHDNDALPSSDPGTYNQFWWEEGGLLILSSMIVGPP